MRVIAVHDNLDLFVAHFKIMKLNHAFFSHSAILPMVGGVTRDAFGSEFSLYNILYFLLPSFAAYMIGYALKIAIGFSSVLILAKDIYKEKYQEYRPILTIIALSFGLIPVFPTYGIAFTSVPLLIYLLRRIYSKPSLPLYIAVFCYRLFWADKRPLLPVYTSHDVSFFLRYKEIAAHDAINVRRVW